MNLLFVLVVLTGVATLVLAEDDQPKATSATAAATTKPDDKAGGDSQVGAPFGGSYGYGSGSRTYYHDSYKRGGGISHGHGYGHGHGFGYGHHHGHGHYGHRSHYTHISSSSGYLGAAQKQQQGEPVVGSVYSPPGPRIPCPHNVLITCQPTVAPVSCTRSY
ncbi:unnamed protein product [Hermetia illucens]|uniref:VM domain-containing protein n=1 Tax=Hermetia illucens TaxID=343691 RepID=A0A7R8YVV5_HERIL|nr:unnamed protein product [Hermetia illucens]